MALPSRNIYLCSGSKGNRVQVVTKEGKVEFRKVSGHPDTGLLNAAGNALYLHEIKNEGEIDSLDMRKCVLWSSIRDLGY